MTQKRVLFWSPYTAWGFHAVQELTLSHALEVRGHTVMVLGCDGLFPACEVFRETTTPRGPNSCARCQAVVRNRFKRMARSHGWLGQLIPRELKDEVERWSESLTAHDLLQARWKGQPVGDWATSSILYQFRASRFDPSNPAMVEIGRQMVTGTAVAWEGLSLVAGHFEPDIIVTFNGRFFSNRVAVEVARARGIRFVTHERSMVKDSIRVHADRLTHWLVNYEEPWARWRDIPLTSAQLEEVERFLSNRRHGKNLGWVAFSPPPQDDTDLRQQLEVGDKPVVAVFSSSLDETATFPEYREGPFPDGRDWLPAVLKMAPRFPEHRFVLRMHPNLRGPNGIGVSNEAMAEVSWLRNNLPANCRLVMPDAKVSSYSLADIASAGMVYASMLGLEMSAEGQPVVAVARGWYGLSGVVRFAQTPDDMEVQLRAALNGGRSLERARAAWRFLHAVNSEVTLPFPLVHEAQPHVGVPTWRTLADLAPGRVPVLDRICRTVIHGGSVRPPPRDADRARGPETEDVWFSRRLPGIFA